MKTTPQEATGKAIYICAAFSEDPVTNMIKVRTIARCLAHAEHLPLVPHLLFPPILDEGTERQLALELCLRLVQLADELWVYGKPTEGMRLEISAAEKFGIPVRFEV